MMLFGDVDVQVSNFAKDVGVPLTVALVGVLGAIITAALSFSLGRWGDAAARRRESYATATKALVAYAEYPWKIRRRTSDSAEELARLTAIGHAMQEELRFHQTWANSENRWAGQIYGEVRDDLARQVRPACNEGWESAPITTAAGMCLGSWGPVDVDCHIERFESAVAFRFGWRRLLGAVHLHPGVVPRPAPEAPRPKPDSGR